ncbi:conserved hypothetical protein [Alkaliphilus metalliredigens QYMF]|uniref:Uncharacterized protein n=1 Tax=Alkaliphilus metalliredigens (strain QYMF) TaxID=293826 RepID=A6TVK5_ALKMQ|nr:hypothetical protein [Alkaliphilus metalliredigens]ABR50223.1 conserved hypothetical protein [Alkaliphilus metalliredigens QYMF]
MKKSTGKKALYGAIIGGVVLVGAFTQMSEANFLEPGSQEDPIVTQSYVETRNEQLRYYIDEKVKGLETQITKGGESVPGNGTPVTGQQQVFEIVVLTQGQQLLGGNSTEMILRGGEATAVGNTAGDGVTNITVGTDLRTGHKVEPNHLLIVPKKDGRGIAAQTEQIWVMVRGEYTIQ